MAEIFRGLFEISKVLFHGGRICTERFIHLFERFIRLFELFNKHVRISILLLQLRILILECSPYSIHDLPRRRTGPC